MKHHWRESSSDWAAGHALAREVRDAYEVELAALRGQVEAAQTTLEQAMTERETLIQRIIALEARLAAVGVTAQVLDSWNSIAEWILLDLSDVPEVDWPGLVATVQAYLDGLPPVAQAEEKEIQDGTLD
jgi:hypothetical protein